MAALKGAFVKLQGRLGSESPVIVFQFNPDTVYRSPTLVLPPQRPDGAGPRDAKNQPAEPSESISFSLRVDATDQIEAGDALARSKGVLPVLAALELLLEPQASDDANLAGGGSGSYQHPPRRLASVLFFWGDQRVLPVAITSLSILETEHDARLNPVRAEVSVNLDVLTPSQLSPDDKYAVGAYNYSRRAKASLAAAAYTTPPRESLLSKTLGTISDKVQR